MEKKQKILVIEDDVYTRELYEEVLKEAGFLVETSVDGEEGIVKINEGTFDLVLLDIMMPKLDGLGVLKKLREKPAKGTEPKIVLLTNLAHDPVIKEALILGAGSYLIKSDLNPDQLVEKVKSLLG